jgi:hypothetical protein
VNVRIIISEISCSSLILKFAINRPFLSVKIDGIRELRVGG